MPRPAACRFAGLLLLACAILVSAACDPFDHPDQPIVIELNEREIPSWYDEAKLGVFIHWGPYAIPGVGEWYRFNMEYDSLTAEYHRETYGEGYPYEAFGSQWAEIMNDSSAWDPAAWADLFARAGARYVVLTAKHHDGFLLWPSDTPNPHIGGWQLERDVVGELADSVRTRGMRFGTYYSGGHDWTYGFPVGVGPFRQLQAHMNDDDERLYTETHYRELVDRYAPSVLWNDIGYPTGAGFELKWRMLADYYAAVPEGVVNDRFLDSSFVQRPLDRNPRLYDLLDLIFGYGGLPARMEAPDLEDIVGRYKPPHYDYLTMEFSEAEEIECRKWERCRTLGGSWGYNRFETEGDMLTGGELIRLLADIVSKNGNLLINVGPTAEGIIPEIQRAPLLAMGEWLEVNGEAIYGSRPWERAEGVTGCGLDVRFTQRREETEVCAIVLGVPEGEEVLIEKFAFSPNEIELLGVGPCTDWALDEEGLRIHLPPLLPDGEAYTFKMTLGDPARLD